MRLQHLRSKSAKFPPRKRPVQTKDRGKYVSPKYKTKWRRHRTHLTIVTKLRWHKLAVVPVGAGD